MRRRLPLISLLLAAVLLAGQALVGAHDSSHELMPGAAHGCVVCTYANAAGHGAVPAVPPVVIAGTVEAPEAILATTEAVVAIRLHPIRGPPALLL
jgi:hypothetical protein